MNKRVSLIRCLMVLLTLWVIACRQNQPDPDLGSVQLIFDNVVGKQELTLNTETYINSSGEQFGVSRLNYFVSNIRLNRPDGTVYVVPQDSSYFLIQESAPASQTLTLNHIPTGEYISVTYLLGVDSLRNTMDISRRKGVLEPGGGHNNGMYWDWNSGYIFFKLEGVSSQVAADPTGEQRFQYHIGLFGGYDTKTINNLRTITVPFKTTGMLVSIGQTTQLTLEADVLKVFEGAAQIRLAINPTVMVSPYSSVIADNYARMFRFSHQSIK